MIGTILILLVVLSLLVFVHEFGHFITAKLTGMKVEEFGFGFPPRLTGIERGGTIYSINWIPLGGFVRIKGESGDDRHDRDSFAGRSAWQRAAVLCAGVAMNLVLAWFALSLGFFIGLPQMAEDLPAGAQVADRRIQIYSVLQDTPAGAAGIQPGDTILTLDGASVVDPQFFRDYTAAHGGRAMIVGLLRDDKPVDVTVTPRTLAETGRPGIGVSLIETGLVSYAWYLAPIQGLAATWYFIREILSSFWTLLSGLFTAHRVTVEFSGPVGIAVMTAEVVRMGFRYLLQFTALLSVNLAVVNILPFPALDGGRVLFLIIERVRRRAVSAKLENLIHNIGFAFLMLLVLVITYRDVVKFGGQIWSSISRYFPG